MVYSILILCFAAVPRVHGFPESARTDDIVNQNMTAPDFNPSSPENSAALIAIPLKSGKVYSNILKVTNRELLDPQQGTADSKMSPSTNSDSKIFVLDNGRTFEVGHRPFQAPLPHLSTAVGAVSAQIISQVQEEYPPYPPNGNPHGYAPYRGPEYDSPLADTYERANSAGYGPYPARNFNSFPEGPKYPNQYQPGCHPLYFSADVGDVERSEFRGRRRKEPIKRHILTPSFG